MSTNIRAYVEYKRLDEYSLFAQVYLEGDYELFALMANVRYEPAVFSGIEPVSPPKGLPLDISKKLKLMLENDGGIEASWLTTEELEEVHRRYMRIPAKDASEYRQEVAPYIELQAIIALLKTLDTAASEPRLVFWFIG
jgi:hypothetical protein